MDAEATATKPTTDLPPETLAYFGGDELRARVFYDKYALRTPDGVVVEATPPQMWRRIARELASVERAPERRAEWEEKFYWLLDDFRLIPGGRIMHGAGNPKRVTLLNCFPAGTPVLTKRGFVPIQQVLPGDEVLTHRDRFKLVTHVTEREVDESLVELSIVYLGDAPIRSTRNHRFFALDASGRMGWTAAEDLTTSHYIRVDRITETIPLEAIDLLAYLDGGGLEEDGQVYRATPFVGGNGAVGVKESRRVNRRIAIDEQFGRWLGYFVAEGGLTDNSVYFTLSKDEPHLAAEIADLSREIFGVDAAIQDRAGQPSHWMRVYLHSSVLVRFLRGLLEGRTGATNKRLPSWFLRVPRNVQKAFVGAVFAGDGIIQETNVGLFLANPELIRQIYTILLRLNVVASIRWEGVQRYTRHRGMRIQVGTQSYVTALKAWIRGDTAAESRLAEVDKNYLYKVVDGSLFLKVRSLALVPASTQTVYDLAVEDDHSFTVGWLGAHNCYVIPVHDDSIESIFDWMKQAARTYSLGGGVGTDISILRPRGAAVNNAARSSTGSVSFMELFSLTTGTIGQSGRRGALMITIADDHPDVLDFVRVKRNLDRVRYANISVRVSDAFMRAVESDGAFTLQFHNERADVRTTIRARDLWTELIRGARDYAEPGLIFWDNIKRWSTSEYNGMGVITTNPCSLVGSTYVMTPGGIRRLDHLVQEAVADRSAPSVVIDRRAEDRAGVDHVRADALAFTGIKPIYRVETTSGYVLRGTGDHKVKVLNDDTVDPLHGSRGWKRIDELAAGDVLAVLDPNAAHLEDVIFRDRSPYLHLAAQAIQPRRRDAHYSLINIPETWDDDLAYLLGYAVGDGCYVTHSHTQAAGKRLDIHMHRDDAPQVKPILDRVTGRYLRSRKVRVGATVLDGAPAPYPLQTKEGSRRAWVSIHSSAFMRMLAALGLRPAVAHEKAVPESILTAPREATRQFLRGLFDADGTVSKPTDQPMVSLSSASRRLIEQVQLLLLQFGIFSSVTAYSAEAKRKTASRLTYTTTSGEHRTYQSVRDTYKLSIGGYPSIERFSRHIGSALPRKQVALEALSAARSQPMRKVAADTRVARVVAEGVSEPVYDLTVLDTKSFIANGLIVSNSEIPLEPYGNCCLSNVNLACFVSDPFASTARVDWEGLEPALRYTTRFLDNVLDYNAERHPLPEQREASLRSRRIGVGFTGLGDMLIKLGLKYDTDGAVTFVDMLFDRIKHIVYDESVNLAQEKGVFPAYDREQHLRSPFIQALAPQLVERIRAHGLRNVALLTVPPVGSGAALAGVTSGIEPIFDLAYVRRSESLSQETFKVYHPLVREYMRKFEVDKESELPPFFVTAHQIKAEMRVKMQAAIQKHIDHSISSTVNLPRETPAEEVERIYLLAWKMGCKGITVYREGSREGILLTEQQAQAAGSAAAAPAAQPAPAAAPAPEPAGPARATPRPRPKVTAGRTERIETPRGRIYVVVNEDEWGVSEVFVHSLDAEADACGRLASLALRAGVDPREIIEQLWRVQSKEVAFDRSAGGTVVRVTTIAQAVGLALGRALYGDTFRPDKEFPRADVLPEPSRVRQEYLRFQQGQSIQPPAGASPQPVVIVAPAAGGNGHHEENGQTEQQRVDLANRLEFVGVCPDCGDSLVRENGCSTCRTCGFSKC